eukprot:11181130-Heterocapsa_arctica.AAC.1
MNEGLGVEEQSHLAGAALAWLAPLACEMDCSSGNERTPRVPKGGGPYRPGGEAVEACGGARLESASRRRVPRLRSAGPPA